MQIPTQLRSGELGFNMTPMIDVVFLLIIFCLVSSHLAKQEAQMQLPLPVADSSREPEVKAARRLTLNVTQDGQLLLVGRPVAAASLQTRLAEALRAEGSELEVRIRSDRNTAYRDIQPVLLACARAGIWNVTFGVYRSQDVSR